MRKLIIAAAFVAISGATYAQKPAAGNVTAEIQLNFQVGDAPVTVNPHYIGGNPVLAARYFLSDDLALRLGVGIRHSSTETDLQETAPGTGTGEVNQSNSGFSVAVGIEKHFAGTSRLSPYIGAQVSFASNSTSADGTNAAFDPNTGGSTFDPTITSFNIDNGSASTLGISIMGGADYYFVDNVYLGVEVGWGFGTTSYGDRESSQTVTAGGTTTTTTTSSPGGNASSLDVFTNSGLRLGFVF